MRFEFRLNIQLSNTQLDRCLAAFSFFAFSAARRGACILADATFIRRFTRRFGTDANELLDLFSAGSFGFFAGFSSATFCAANGGNAAAKSKRCIFSQRRRQLIGHAL